MKIYPLDCIDFYKANHRPQYPKKTQLVYSNLTARSTHYLPKIEGTDDKIVFFGLQFFIKDFLIDLFDEKFFSQSKSVVVGRYKRRMDTALGPNAVDVSHIAALHDLGYLPISIRALPEGAVLDAKIPFFTIENTLPEFFWLTNYLETIISNYVWKPITSATLARKYKQLITNYTIATGAPLDFVKFQGHDFSFRGMSGIQDAVMSGAAHLTSFVGTDTVPAIDFLEDYYGADAEKELIGCSVPATEHSVMCMGMKDGELETFKRLITEVHPEGIVSIVSDTWDFWNVVDPNGGIMARLKDIVLSRKGKVVIRPDSGDPVKIVVGYNVVPTVVKSFSSSHLEQWLSQGYDAVRIEGGHGTFAYPLQELYNNYNSGKTTKGLSECEVKGLIECLYDTFGGSKTDKGYIMLHPNVGAIYGDSITLPRADAILCGLMKKGFASNNIVFGIGSFTYEYQTRDTLGTAMKATAGIVDSEFREIFKDPKTDSNSFKKSAKGYLAVKRDSIGNYVLVDQVSEDVKNNDSELKEVFRDGKLIVDSTLSLIRAKINDSIKQ
jgi:nicotinamide phosphoribosyltransferase